MLFSEPKIPQCASTATRSYVATVSVLFSEPKIPQFPGTRSPSATRQTFQCSSASRKFLNQVNYQKQAKKISNSFSALQRAENSSITVVNLQRLKFAGFSALQRAENSSIDYFVITFEKNNTSFSALQRAENSSIMSWGAEHISSTTVSVLFSEPKIPQSSVQAVRASMLPMFQCSSASRKFLNHRSHPPSACSRARFSALQRAENSSMFRRYPRRCCNRRFQCSSASRKFLNRTSVYPDAPVRCGFSALQRAENSSIVRARRRRSPVCGSFSALQRAENSSMTYVAARLIALFRFQCSSASRKFLNFCNYLPCE